MAGSGSRRPDDPWTGIRKTLLLAVAMGFMATLAVAAVTLVVAGSEPGRDVLAGALIGLLPNVWFLQRATGANAGRAVIAVALTRYALVGAGFALWFYSTPRASIEFTLAGTLGVLLATSAAIHWLQRRAV